MTALAETGKNKISRRQKARAKKTLNKAFWRVMSEIDNDQFLRNHLFLQKAAKDKLIVGGYIVRKTDKGLFDVYKRDLKHKIHENLYSFDAAMAIVESLNADHPGRVKKIVKAEEEYMKAYNDMHFYKHGYNRALKEGSDNLYVYEDRFTIARNNARKALKEIRRYRIVQ